MAPIRSSLASFLPELTLVPILAHKHLNCMKPLYRLKGMNKCLRYPSVSGVGAQPQPGFPPGTLNVHPQDGQDSVLRNRLGH